MPTRKKRTGLGSFAKTLRNLMAERGVTVREAGKIAGVSHSVIDDWRAGALPEDYLAVKRLGKGLGVSMSFLLTGEDDSRPTGSTLALSEVFEDGGELFDGYAKITIQRLVPRRRGSK